MDRVEVLACLSHQGVERLSTAKRGGSRAGAYPGPILRDAGQIDEILAHQQRQHLRDQIAQLLAAVTAKVAERVVAHVDPAAEPAIRHVLLRQPPDLASAPFTIARRVHPQREQDLGIDRRRSRHTRPRLDRAVERE